MGILDAACPIALSDFSSLHGVHGRLDAQLSQGHGDRSAVVAVAQTHGRRGTAGGETGRSRALLDGLRSKLVVPHVSNH